MSKHAPGRIPKGTKWGVCSACGYRIRPDREEYDLVGDMEFVHARCVDDYDGGGCDE